MCALYLRIIKIIAPAAAFQPPKSGCKGTASRRKIYKFLKWPIAGESNADRTDDYIRTNADHPLEQACRHCTPRCEYCAKIAGNSCGCLPVLASRQQQVPPMPDPEHHSRIWIRTLYICHPDGNRPLYGAYSLDLPLLERTVSDRMTNVEYTQNL